LEPIFAVIRKTGGAARRLLTALIVEHYTHDGGEDGRSRSDLLLELGRTLSTRAGIGAIRDRMKADLLGDRAGVLAELTSLAATLDEIERTAVESRRGLDQLRRDLDAQRLALPAEELQRFERWCEAAYPR